jgi:hypothetical protein
MLMAGPNAVTMLLFAACPLLLDDPQFDSCSQYIGYPALATQGIYGGKLAV